MSCGRVGWTSAIAAIADELIAAGEIPVCLTAYSANVETLKRKGAPIDFAPIDAIARPQGLGIAKSAPHPAAALLYVLEGHSGTPTLPDLIRLGYLPPRFSERDYTRKVENDGVTYPIAQDVPAYAWSIAHGHPRDDAAATDALRAILGRNPLLIQSGKPVGHLEPDLERLLRR
mgnify:CR=1 FL=1